MDGLATTSLCRTLTSTRTVMTAAVIVLVQTQLGNAQSVDGSSAPQAPLPLVVPTDSYPRPIRQLPLPRKVRPRARVVKVADSPIVHRIADADSTSRTPIQQPISTRRRTHESPSEPSSEPPTRKPVSVEEALATRGSVTFRKTPLSEVVFLLSELWHVNIVAGENVNGEVSGAFHDAPLREVLVASLSASGYSYRKSGSSLIVLPAADVGTDNPEFDTRTIRLPPQLVEDESAIEAAELLLSDRGQMRPVGSDTVLIVDMPERIARVEALFAGLTPAGSQPPTSPTSLTPPTSSTPAATPGSLTPASFTQDGIAYFTPQFTEAEQMAEPLREALGPHVVVAVYPEENRVMVRGTSSDLKLASEAIEQLDVPRQQVRITAMLYDVTIREAERLGVDWSAIPHSRSTALANINDPDTARFRNAVRATTSLITDPTAAGAANFAVSTINDTLNVDTLIQCLESSSEAKLLANPSITVRDRNQASIRIVQRIPILAADPVDNSGVVFSQVQFEDAGVILQVRPRISRDGTIELDVQPEYSVVADFIENNPVIDQRTAQTSVRVNNGQTFALGGLRQKTLIETVRGVPGLRNLKFVGKLFRSHDTEIRESELIVFLRPEVVTSCEPGTPRDRQTACVINQQLDAIPHAETGSLIRCCQDPRCPNHHPKPKVNGGSRALWYNGFPVDQHGEVVSESVELMVDPEMIEAPHGQADVHVAPAPYDGSSSVIDLSD